MRRPLMLRAFALFVAAMAGAPGRAAEDSGPAPAMFLVRDSGGAATSTGDERRVLAARIHGLTDEQRTSARQGEAFFNTSFIPSPSEATRRDGLGPLFNSANCRSCHNSLGRGRPPAAPDQQPVALVLQLGAPREDGSWGDEPVYGLNYNPFAIPGVEPEGAVVIDRSLIRGSYRDGTAWELQTPIYRLTDLRYGELHPHAAISPRLAQPIIGMGLLDAVPEDVILALADPDDADGDGISGRPNWIDVGEGRRRLGRFGWKANQPDLRTQTTAALFAEMGITSSDRPEQNCTALQAACLAGPHGGDPEIADADLADLVFFQRVLAVPPRRELDDPEVIRGAALFHEAGCGTCHVPRLVTGEVPDVAALSRQEIFPFTDLLLHDMGPELADGRPDHQASGTEWRTPPLWGLGRAGDVAREAFYLHDGRARSLEEAILWHGGEAAPARARFIAWDRAQRHAVVRFLESL
jgi:CxxC motif-containing protein (DUF1111 family)